MLIAGLDLAAEPKATALSLIDWLGKTARLVQLELNIDDKLIVDSTRDAVKLGIDCALGWPIEFVEFLNRYSQNSFSQIAGDMSWRRRMAYRETDRAVRELTGRWPLSVSTDRLGLTAMRCAGLLSKLSADGVEIDRTGAGKVVEIYPSASLRLWGFDTSGYRASAAARAALLEQICEASPWFEPHDFAELMVESCDAFDAVIANFAARSSSLGLSTTAPESVIKNAQIEGWLSLPRSALSDLVN
jgi:predicted nuclease with RNAse H fold